MSNYSDWEREFSGFVSVELAASYKKVEKLAEAIYNRVVYYTPVGNPALWSYPAPLGYVPGTLRDSWELDSSAWNSSSGGYLIVSTDVVYALRVENGWSTQAPAGMMRRAINDVIRSSNANNN